MKSGRTAVAGLAMLCMAILPLAVFLSIDPLRSMVAHPDPEFSAVYQAVLIANGEGQRDSAHPAYTLFVLLSWWLRAARALGTISALVPAELAQLSPDQFLAVWGRMIESSRWFALAIAELVAFGFMAAVLTVTGNRPAALAAGLLMAATPGLLSHVAYARSDALCSLLVMTVLATVAMAAKRDGLSRQAWLTAAGMVSALALETKVQTLLPLLAIPPLGLLLGRKRPLPSLSPTTAQAILAASLLVCIAGIAYATIGLTAPERFKLVRFIALPIGTTQILAFAYVTGAMAVYAVWHKIPRLEAATAMAGLWAGLAAGLLLTAAYYSKPTVIAVTDPLNHMRNFAGDAIVSPEAIMTAMGNSFHSRLHFGPAMAGVVVALAGWLIAALRRKWRTMLVIAITLGTGAGVQAVSSLRYNGAIYLYDVLSEPWYLLAGALGAAEVLTGAMLAAIPLASLAVAVISVVSVISAPLQSEQPSWNACVQAKGYLPEFADHFSRYCPKDRPAEPTS